MKLKLIVLALVAAASALAVSGALAAKTPPKKPEPKKKGTAQVCSAKANVELAGALREHDEEELLMIVYTATPEVYEGREITVTLDKNTKYTRDDEKVDVDELMEDDDVLVSAKTCKRAGFSKVKLVATKVVAMSSVGEAEEEEEEE